MNPQSGDELRSPPQGFAGSFYIPAHEKLLEML
jgi:hypothetical protein